MSASTARTAFAARINVKPGQLNHLMRLIDTAASAQTDEHNREGAPDSTPAINAVEAYAKQLGYDCYWPGLYPVLRNKDGQEFHLPE